MANFKNSPNAEPTVRTAACISENDKNKIWLLFNHSLKELHTVHAALMQNPVHKYRTQTQHYQTLLAALLQRHRLSFNHPTNTVRPS